MLWIEPVLRKLAKKNKRIYVHTKFNKLFNNFPLKNVFFKDHLNFFEKVLVKTEQILGTSFLTINLDMSYEKDPKKHFLEVYLAKTGLPFTREYPKLYLSENETNAPLPLIGRKYVVLHLESASEKNFRKTYGVKWPVVVEYLRKLGFTIVQIGKKSAPIENTIQIQTNLRELISLIHNCSFFIGYDSGPSHIAAALNKPSLIFFGSVNPQYRHFPDLAKIIVLQQYCEYQGCYHEVISEEGQTCKLVGDNGIPKCCIFSDKQIIEKIDELIKLFQC